MCRTIKEKNISHTTYTQTHAYKSIKQAKQTFIKDSKMINLFICRRKEN